MNTDTSTHAIDYIRYFEEKGYVASYICKNGRIQNTENKKWYEPNDLLVVEEFRYEGMSNPADNAILYIIEAKDGTKGTTLVPYGPTADADFVWFFKKVPVKCKKQFDPKKMKSINAHLAGNE